MRRVTCKDCKHAYDYDKDDFCPRCGSYNPPPDTGSTKLEQELLSRFGAARAAQTRQTQQSQRFQGSSGSSAQPQWSPRPKAPQGHANHTPIGGAVRCEQRPRKSQNGLVTVVVVMILVATLMACVVMANLSGEWDFSLGSAVAEYTETDWAVGDTFPLNDVMVTVDGAWWVDTEGTLLARDGFDLLLVDVWIEGGTYDAKAQISSPYLALPDGEMCPLEAGADLAKRVKNQTGAYVVDLRDYMWEDPLCGSFAFYVPAGTDQALLCLDELDSRGNTAALNRVALDLPAR